MLGFQKPFGQKSPVGPRGGLGPWAAASQTCLPTCRFCVAILHLRDRFGWHAARLPVLLQRIDELGLSRKKQLEQSASLLNRGLALVGLLDGRAMLLGFVAQCQQWGGGAPNSPGILLPGIPGIPGMPPNCACAANGAAIKTDAKTRARQTRMALPRCP